MTRSQVAVLAVAALGAALLCVGVASAQGNIVLIDNTPRLMKAGFYSGSTAANSSGNKVTGVFEASTSYNFGALSATCLDSPAITVTGAQATDPCFVGVDYAAATTDPDGGTALAANVVFSCYTKANQAYVRACSPASGVDIADAGFRVRVISSR